MSSRRASRERLLQVLYQYQVAGQWTDLAVLQQAFPGAGREGSSPEDEPFLSQLHAALQERRSEIDRLIEEASRNWRLARMAAVDLSVLRLATAELLVGTAPPRVVLNEAVELAKQYGAETSATFVNGVLDGVLRRLHPPDASD